MLELPISEDIYDFDTFTLRDYYEKIVQEAGQLEQIQDKPKEVNSWLKKAKKLLDMISLEIEERQAVEEFGEFCKRGESYLASLDNFNPYANNKSLPTKSIKIENDPRITGTVIMEDPETEANSHVENSEKSTRHSSSYYNEEAKSISNDSRVSGFQTEEPGDKAQKIYETMHHGRKNNVAKKPTKKNELYEFMKQTLSSTRVTDDKLAIGKSSVAGTQKKPEYTPDGHLIRRENSVDHSTEQQNKPKSQPLRKPTAGFSTKDTKVSNQMEIGSAKPKTLPPIKATMKKKSSSMDSSSQKPKKQISLAGKELKTYAADPKGSNAEERSEKRQSTASSAKSSETNLQKKPPIPKKVEVNKGTIEKVAGQNKENEEEKIEEGLGSEEEEDNQSEDERQTINISGTKSRSSSKPKNDTVKKLTPKEQTNIGENKKANPNQGEISSQNQQISNDREVKSESIPEKGIVQVHSISNEQDIDKIQSTPKMEKQLESAQLPQQHENQQIFKETPSTQAEFKEEPFYEEGELQSDNEEETIIQGKKTPTSVQESQLFSTKENPSVRKEKRFLSQPPTPINQSLQSIAPPVENNENTNRSRPNQSEPGVQKNDISDDDEIEIEQENPSRFESEDKLTSQPPTELSFHARGKRTNDSLQKSPEPKISPQKFQIKTTDINIQGNQSSKSSLLASISHADEPVETPTSNTIIRIPNDSQKRLIVHGPGFITLSKSKSKESLSGSQSHLAKISVEMVRENHQEAQDIQKNRQIFEKDRRNEQIRASQILKKQENNSESATKQTPTKEVRSSIEQESTTKRTENEPQFEGSATKKVTKPMPTKKNDFINIPDDRIVDYSHFVSSFQELFTGSLINQANFDYLAIMRETLSLFSTHVGKVDNMDGLLSQYKPSLAPLEFAQNDIIALNNPTHILMYATKTNIDLRKFIERQNTFNQNVRLIQDDDSDQVRNENPLYYRVVKTKQEVYDIITRSFLRKRNWVELPHGMNLKTTWNLLWTWSKPEIDMNKLIRWQRVNHFPGNKAIVRKDCLKTNIERMQKLGAKAAQAFAIIPLTYFLPKEVTKFMETFYEHMEKEGQLNIWILKPVGKSRGRGISVINDIMQVKYSEPVVLQKYLKTPLLLDGYKFDMRIYALVTSITPLEVYVYKEGFARLSTAPYSLDESDLKNLYIHLTNTSVQKYNHNANNQTSDAIIGGTKISLKTLRTRLEFKGIKWQTIWDQVGEIIVKSLVAVQGEIQPNPNCFELFGYDIIIDRDQKCWLLEVNSSPSLERMNILDDLIKQQLIDDIIDLVGPINFDRKRFCQVLERRIQEEQRVKSTINTSNNSKQQLNKDLTYILHGQPMRKHEDLPENIGNFERLAPTEMSDRIIKLVQSYKVPRTVGK